MYLCQPELLQILKTLLFGHIVYHNNSMGPLIVGPSYGPKSFLSSGVPNLQLNHIPVNRNRSTIYDAWLLKSKIDSDGGQVTFLEGVVRKST